MFNDTIKFNLVRNYIICFISLLSFFSLNSCLELGQTYTMVAPGTWRGKLDLRDQATLPLHPEHTDPSTEFDFSATPDGVLPFQFEVSYLSGDSMVFHLINGTERIRVEHYKFIPNIEGETGEVTLFFPVYDTHIKAKVEAGVMEGTWFVNHRKNYSIPFVAHLGENFRFTDIPELPIADVSGRWEVVFNQETEESYPAIGEFTQVENELTGTILTETGDYRYASGQISGDDFMLSSFDGSQAYLYEGKIVSPDSIIGAFYSGNHYRTTWEGKRNSEALLRSPDSITIAIKNAFDLSGESIEGQKIDFNKDPYLDQIKIVEIMGSWCPNCHDEALFLKEWKAQNSEQPVSIVSIAYERYEDQIKSLEILQRFLDKYGISWPVIYGGTIAAVDESPYVSYLNGIKAFPTLIVFDRENKIRYVHTGFNGPATSEYAKFKKGFGELIQKLVNEN